MRFIETAFLVIHAGYEGGDIAEKKNNPRFFLQWSLPSWPPWIIKENICLFIF